MSKKKTYEEVKKAFEDRGYTLLTTEYKNNKQKLEFICPEGHRSSINLNNFINGHGCIVCGYIEGRNKLKLSFEEVKQEFESRDYQLLSTEYINSSSKLEYICPNGHRGKISFNNFRKGSGCKICGYDTVSKKLKFTLKTIKKEFEKYNYILLSDKYEYSSNKLKYICPNGHRGEISWNDFKQGHRCSRCHFERVAEKNRAPFNIVKQTFTERGYKLISTEYINCKQKLKYICPNGHKGEITFDSFKQGKGCKICGYRKVAEKLKVSFDAVKQTFEDRGYILLSKTYIDSKGRLEYICPEGHRGTICWNNFQQGAGCLICAREQFAKNLKLPLDFIKSEFEKENYTLLTTEYTGCEQKLKYICPKGHEGETTWGNFQQGHRCPICSTRISKPETEIFEFLKPHFKNIKHNIRKIIPPLELDIFIPELNVAIEYCGVHWHSEQMKKDRYYHLNKLERCLDKNIRLITIFEDEYVYHKDIVLARLKSILNISNNRRVFGRDCSIREIDSITKRDFLDKYHLQGSDRSEIKIGAYLDDELISVMTFSKPSIAKGAKSITTSWELNRFCTRYDVSGVGIASKLLNYFIKEFKPFTIFSYADRRWSDGNLYYELGFELDKYTPPNYWYVIGQDRIHRFNFRKNVLDKKLEIFDPNLTEYENMLVNGIDRVWDCGNLKFIKNFHW